jgi:FkbM family methyltransferase
MKMPKGKHRTVDREISHPGWAEIETLCDDLKRMISGLKRLRAGVAIFGSGYQGGLLHNRLAKAGVTVKYFIDNDTAKQGSTAHGTRIFGPTVLRSDPPDLIFIAIRNAVPQIKAQLAEEGQTAISSESFTVVRDFADFVQVRGLLADERSRQVYDSVLMARLTDDDRYYVDVFEANQYFALPRFAAPARDHFVDAGAFVGDTIERLLWASGGNVAQIYAFEPGPAQATALRRRVLRLAGEWALAKEQVECLQAGLGAVSGMQHFDTKPGVPSAASFKTSQTSEKIEVCALDDFLNGRPATFIKADVEGMELELLAGARRTIQGFRPRLALSVYHDPTHLYAIPLFVNALVPEYRMAIRHHAPNSFETVLYCWIA